jgi:hypothetical protein
MTYDFLNYVRCARKIALMCKEFCLSGKILVKKARCPLYKLHHYVCTIWMEMPFKFLKQRICKKEKTL